MTYNTGKTVVNSTNKDDSSAVDTVVSSTYPAKDIDISGGSFSGCPGDGTPIEYFSYATGAVRTRGPWVFDGSKAWNQSLAVDKACQRKKCPLGTNTALCPAIQYNPTATQQAVCPANYYFDVGRLICADQIPAFSGFPIALGKAKQGASYSVSFTVTDPDVPSKGDAITWIFSGAPSWLTGSSIGTTINISAATIPDSETRTSYSITATARDMAGQSASQVFDFTVYLKPKLSGTPPTEVAAGAVFPVFTPTKSDPNNDIVSFSISGNPSWLTVNSATGSITGQAPLSDAGKSYTVTLTATDAESLTGTLAFTFTVVNKPPVAVISSPSSDVQKNVDAAAFDASLSSDPNVGDTLTYAWNFGDGQTASGITASHPYVTAGVHTVTLTVTDAAGATI